MEYKNYRQLDKRVDKLVEEKKYEEAIGLLEKAWEKFPNDLYEILWYQAAIYAMRKDSEKCLVFLEDMAARKFFSELEWPIFDFIRDDPRFRIVFEENKRLKIEAQKNASMEYQVFTPDGYSSGKQYPLFIALHGDGNSLEYFKYNWESTEILNEGFVLAYIQSSQVVCTNGYGWTSNYEKARQDIKAAYDEIVAQYSIDTDTILIGGFSGGSIAAIEITMANTLPVKGFVSLCPSLKPDSFAKENVEQAARRGVKGVILEGEKEGDVPAEQEMMAVFEEVKFPYQFHVNPNIGHSFPLDFPKKLLDAIAFIMD